MKYQYARKIKCRYGMSLLETLLAVGVSAVFFAFTINIGRTIAIEQMVQAAASYVEQIDSALNTLYSDPERFNIIYNGMPASGIRELTLGQLRDGGAIASIEASPVLGTSFPTVGPLGQTYSIVIRIADNRLIPTDPRVLETFIVSDTLIEDELALRISAALDGNGGALRNETAVIGSTIRGAFGAWSAPTNNLNGSAWYNTVTAAAAPTVNNGAYVVAYRYYDINRIAKDYLYRRDMSDPALNRMESDLAMSGFNVLGVDNIDTSGTIAGAEIIAKGAVSLNGNATIAGNVQGDGPSGVTGNVNSASNLSLSAVNGAIAIQSSVSTGTSVFDTLSTNGFVVAGGLTPENVALTSGTLDATSSVGINAGVATDAFVVSGNTSLTGTGLNGALNASRLETDNLTVSARNTATIFMRTNGDYRQPLNFPDPSGFTDVARYSGNGLTRVQGPTNWTCTNGC